MRPSLLTTPLRGLAPVLKDGKPDYVESVRPTAFEAKIGALISYRRKTE